MKRVFLLTFMAAFLMAAPNGWAFDWSSVENAVQAVAARNHGDNDVGGTAYSHGEGNLFFTGQNPYGNANLAGILTGGNNRSPDSAQSWTTSSLQVSTSGGAPGGYGWTDLFGLTEQASWSSISRPNLLAEAGNTTMSFFEGTRFGLNTVFGTGDSYSNGSSGATIFQAPTNLQLSAWTNGISFASLYMACGDPSVSGKGTAHIALNYSPLPGTFVGAEGIATWQYNAAGPTYAYGQGMGNTNALVSLLPDSLRISINSSSSVNTNRK